jgi:hypothetical protein
MARGYSSDAFGLASVSLNGAFRALAKCLDALIFIAGKESAACRMESWASVFRRWLSFDADKAI